MTGGAPQTVKVPGGADSEHPSPELMRVYGEYLFLALRSPQHARLPLAQFRAWVEVPLLLGHFRVFRFDDIARGLITWARLSPEAERRYVFEHTLQPEDWRSGDRLWLIDLIGPYRGMASGLARWTMTPGNFADHEFKFRRVYPDGRPSRIVHIDFTRKGKLINVLSESDFR